MNGDDSEEQYKDASRRKRAADSTNRERDGETDEKVRGTQSRR